MNRNGFFRQRGFVALIAAVIVSVALMVAAAPAARAAFWSRFNLLARENQKIARERAVGCVELVLRGIAKNETITAWSECDIGEVKDVGSGIWEINAAADWKNSFAKLKATAKAENGTISIIDWQEF